MRSAVALIIPMMGVGVAYLAIYLDHRHRMLQYEERRMMIEKGMTPPPIPGLLDRKRPTPEECLRRGIIMSLLGVALGLGYFVLRETSGGPPDWLFGVSSPIVGLVGLGYLIYYFIVRGQKPVDESEDRIERR